MAEVYGRSGGLSPWTGCLTISYDRLAYTMYEGGIGRRRHPSVRAALGNGQRVTTQPTTDAPWSCRYMTNARFSSSFCNTGMEQPDISTRPAASTASCGETP